MKPCGQIKDYKLLIWEEKDDGQKTLLSVSPHTGTERHRDDFRTFLQWNSCFCFLQTHHPVLAYPPSLTKSKETFLFGFSGGYSLIFDHSVGP